MNNWYIESFQWQTSACESEVKYHFYWSLFSRYTFSCFPHQYVSVAFISIRAVVRQTPIHIRNIGPVLISTTCLFLMVSVACQLYPKANGILRFKSALRHHISDLTQPIVLKIIFDLLHMLPFSSTDSTASRASQFSETRLPCLLQSVQDHDRLKQACTLQASLPGGLEKNKDGCHFHRHNKLFKVSVGSGVKKSTQQQGTRELCPVSSTHC